LTNIWISSTFAGYFLLHNGWNWVVFFDTRLTRFLWIGLAWFGLIWMTKMGDFVTETGVP
jgi:hypothetical protein